MGLVFLGAGLAELVGVVCGAPRWSWIAVAIWLGGGSTLVALATAQLHRAPGVRVPL
jgi:hypothetical protein